ncbi:isocitrate/isopropylmalate dehydrogenase family protein [bacterium]
MSIKYKITLLPGDGIGPEITAAAKLVIQAAGVDIEWEEFEAGINAVEKYNEPLPSHVLESIKKNKAALKAPITTPIGKGFRSVNVELRKSLELFANVRPSKTIPGIKTRYDNVDLVIVRENTEDLYSGVEFCPETEEANKIIEMSNNKILKSSAISIKPISKYATERIVDFSFKFAEKNNRKKITAVTKANIMKCTDGLFLDTAREVAKKYPKIKYEEKLIDNMCMQLVQNPEQFDVLVMPNLYGDIVSDLCAGLIGGLGIAQGANIGKDTAVFEAVHGSAPDIAGLDKANPTALILSAVMMLEYLGEKKAALLIRTAVEKVLKEGRYITSDIGGTCGTKQMAEEIAKRIYNTMGTSA